MRRLYGVRHFLPASVVCHGKGSIAWKWQVIQINWLPTRGLCEIAEEKSRDAYQQKGAGIIEGH